MLKKILSLFRLRKKSSPALTKIRRDDGSIVLMDSLTVKYLHSTAPNPTQASLDRLWEGVTRVRILAGGVYEEKALGNEVLLERTDASFIQEFRQRLAIDEHQSNFGHCMCLGDYALELYSDDRRVATIGLHHGKSIRWAGWRADADLRDGLSLLNFLADHGVFGPLKDFEEDRRSADEQLMQYELWRRRMPEGLYDLLQSNKWEPDILVTVLLERLEQHYPNLDDRVLALFEWFGAGAGPWSGHPAYETIAEELLLEFPTHELVSVLERHELSTRQMEGAARYFAGWNFNHRKAEDRRLLPERLRRMLLEHSLLTAEADEDKAHRAKSAFGSENRLDTENDMT